MSSPASRDRAPPTQPPFWRSLTPDELAHYGDVQAEPSTPTPGTGWMPAAFRAFIPACGPALIHGWVKPPFALHQAFADASILGQVTHLPTGNLIGTFRSVPEAAFATAVIEPVTDWAAVTVTTAHTIIDATADAIEGVGFGHRVVRIGAIALPVWERGPLN